nr:RcpC/CpaB family pilus assembly protein [Streptomyces composti]
MSLRQSARPTSRPSSPQLSRQALAPSVPPRVSAAGSPVSGPPGAEVPPPCEVPHFPPVRVRAGLLGSPALARHRRRAVAVGLAVTAAALVAAGPRDGSDRSRGHPERTPASRAAPAATGERAPARTARAVAARVSAPVRISDAATVRLLRPGDRVDVIAAEDTATGGKVRVVARGARVLEVPEPEAEVPKEAGALVVLSVPRPVAAELAGASATARLAVTLC